MNNIFDTSSAIEILSQPENAIFYDIRKNVLDAHDSDDTYLNTSRILVRSDIAIEALQLLSVALNYKEYAVINDIGIWNFDIEKGFVLS